jgi:hypothetical protein
MTRLTLIRAAVTAVAVTLLIPSSAWADQVSGLISRTYVLVEDTDLIGDVTCDVVNSACFSFGAPGIQLRLNGFTITGRADPITGCAGGIVPAEFGILTNGQNNVQVRGPGLVQRFRNSGVFVTGSTGARVADLTASTNCGSGIHIAGTSFETVVEGNVTVRNGSTNPGASCGGI